MENALGPTKVGHNKGRQSRTCRGSAVSRGWSDDDEDVDGQLLRGGVLRLDGGGVLEDVQKEVSEEHRTDRASRRLSIPPRMTTTCMVSRQSAQLDVPFAGYHQADSEACRQRVDTDMADEEEVKDGEAEKRWRHMRGMTSGRTTLRQKRNIRSSWRVEQFQRGPGGDVRGHACPSQDGRT